jgi:O-antigen/teichoic acid export membrane protein
VAQAIRAIVVLVGLPIAVIAGAADPLIAVVFGEQWLPAADIVLAVSPGVLAASAGAALFGAALAEGNARLPLTAAVVQALVVVAASVPLVTALGGTGAGLTTTLGAFAFTGVLALGAPRDTRAAATAVARALAITAAAAVAGNLASTGTEMGPLLLAVATAGAVWLGLYALTGARDLRLVLRLLRQHLRRPGAVVESPAA